MIITCPECATEFKTPDHVFANGPRKVRCMKCAHVWTHEPADDQATVAEQSDDFMTSGAETGSADGTDWEAEAETAGGEAEDPFDFDSFGDDEAGSADEADDFDSLGAAEPGDERTSDDEASDASDDDVGDDAAAIGDDADGEAEKPEIHPLEFLDDEPADKPAAKPAGKGSKAKGDGKAKGGPSALRKWAGPLAACLVLFASGYGAYAYRETVTRWVPAAAQVYAMLGLPVNLTGLEFHEVGITRSFDNGFPILSVKGRLTNVSRRERFIPDIRLALRTLDRQEIYHWTIKVKRAPLKPNETVQFSTRLASPPAEAQDIEIRFHKKSGLQVGAL